MSTSKKSREDACPLRDEELLWRDRYAMLESHGYRLRQRYKPDWKPSWLTTNRPLFRHEDFQWRNSAYTMDAVRISDGRRVFLKRIPSASSELAIHRFLSDPEKLRDPDNHTVPLIDEFPDDDNALFTYMVMPLLCPFYSSEYFSVDEVLDFVKQLIEGLAYMHKHGVAHRDCSVLNIMMDAEVMYPKGFHPVSAGMDASGIKLARPKRRREAGGVRYYFIDFGISSRFAQSDPKEVVGVDGQDWEVPELSETEPYNPFFTDVFIVGNFIKKEFLKQYINLGFLVPLVEEMTRRDWRDRCTAYYSLYLFNIIVPEQSWYSRRWRLKERDAGAATHFFQDVDTISRESTFLARTIIVEKSKEAVQFFRERLKLKKCG